MMLNKSLRRINLVFTQAAIRISFNVTSKVSIKGSAIFG